MEQDEKILTLHPEGKKGVNISRKKYDAMKEVVLHILEERREVAWREMIPLVKTEIGPDFEGSVPWYFESVKLDLQAKGEIKVENIKGLQYLYPLS